MDERMLKKKENLKEKGGRDDKGNECNNEEKRIRR